MNENVSKNVLNIKIYNNNINLIYNAKLYIIFNFYIFNLSKNQNVINCIYFIYRKLKELEMNYSIANDYILPSEGKIYENEIKSQVKLRSMTTLEEMKRLNHSEYAYKQMAEIIDDCIVEDIGISAYDLCIADYQYLLHKLRIVTYGTDYKITTTCPFCTCQNKHVYNLDDLSVTPFNEDTYKECSEFVLPVCGKRIKLKMQTPRILDNITYKAKDYRRKNPNAVGDPAFLFTLEALIDTIDGQKPEQFKILPFIQGLAMMDTNYILKKAEKLNTSFGIDSQVELTCNICGLDYTSNFRATSEFFGPSID